MFDYVFGLSYKKVIFEMSSIVTNRSLFVTRNRIDKHIDKLYNIQYRLKYNKFLRGLYDKETGKIHGRV